MVTPAGTSNPFGTSDLGFGAGSSPPQPVSSARRAAATQIAAERAFTAFTARFPPTAGSAPGEARREPVAHLGERDPLLLHGVAVTDRRRLVVQRVEVDRDAERRPDLVLAAVPPADRPGVVEL